MLSCPICRHGSMVSFHRKTDQELIICEVCRHVTWSNIPDDLFLSEYYQREYTETHDQNNIQQELKDYYDSHAAELAGVAAKSLSQLSIVDVGCSYPIFLERAKNAGLSKALGVDWSPEAKLYGASHGVDVITPPEFDDEEDEQYDVLRYSHCLEHTRDPGAFLLSHAKKLKIGGLLYVTQPNFPVFTASPSRIDIQDSVWPTHLHFFNPVSMRRMLEDCGFEITRYFSVGDGAAQAQRYREIMDVTLAKVLLADLANKGERERGPQNNYPYYAAENSAYFAIRRR